MRSRDSDRPFVIGIFTSDWHIDAVPPALRESEPDWWAAQQRPIDEIKAIKNRYKCPVFFAGDLFNKAKPDPETINWALKHVPEMYGIPGNHDLVHHRYEDIEKCGYWTMVQANRIIDLRPGFPHPCGWGAIGVMVHAFPYGTEVKSIASNLIDGFNVALIHAYVWKKNCGYTGAPADKRVGAWEKRLGNFSHAFYGDNHRSFLYQGENTLIGNCGCTVKRRSDELSYEPGVFLLWSDGEVSEKKLDCSLDKYTQREAPAGKERVEVDAEKLIESLKGLQQKTKIDFVATCREVMRSMQVGQDVEEKVLEALG